MSELKTVAWQHPSDVARYNTATALPQSMDDVPLVLLSDAQAKIDRLQESLRAERAVSERLLEGIQKAIDRTKPILGVPDRASHIVAPLYAAIDEVEAMRAKERED